MASAGGAARKAVCCALCAGVGASQRVSDVLCSGAANGWGVRVPQVLQRVLLKLCAGRESRGGGVMSHQPVFAARERHWDGKAYWRQFHRTLTHSSYQRGRR